MVLLITLKNFDSIGKFCANGTTKVQLQNQFSAEVDMSN